MRTINNKKELAEFFRDELLPYYEQHYREDLTLGDAYGLNLEAGLCLCAKDEFNVRIYGITGRMIFEGWYLFSEVMHYGYTAKESLLPRIEWMRQFIKENIV
jgi:hypothetical protein